MACLLQFTILAIIVAFSCGELKITPDVSDLLIKEGSSQELTCTSSSRNTLNWDFPDQDDQGTSRTTTSGDGGAVASIKFNNFTNSKAGEYVCTQTVDGQVLTEEINLVSISETKLEPTYQYGNNSAKLSCIITSATKDLKVEKVTWKKGDMLVSDLPESARFDEGTESNSLIINKPKNGDTGAYQAVIKLENIDTPYDCEVEFKEEVIQFNPTKVEPTYYPGNDSATLSCNIDGGRKVKHVEWLKNGTNIDDLGKPAMYVVSPNNSLIINDPERKNAGLYTARFTIEDLPEPYDCNVMFRAGPEVLSFPKSKNLIEKDKMELQCQIEGFPRPVASWFKNGIALNVSQDERIELHTLNGYKNARLVIKNIEFSDEGEYTCKAYSSYFNETDEKNITVRVKDKLAALWPFLGIVCEVIILCTIIFIYEKRRNKRAEREENKAQEAFIKEQKEGIRHRNQKK